MVNQTKTSNVSSAIRRPLHRWTQICLQIIVGIVILSCGIVIGSGAALLHLKDRIEPGRRPPIEVIIKDMRTRYDLTPEQAEKAETVLGKSREEMQTLFEEFGRKIEAEFQKISLEMKEILTPEQYKRWENDFKARRRPGPREHRPGRPGPEKPGPGRPGPGKPGYRRSGPDRPEPPEPNST